MGWAMMLVKQGYTKRDGSVCVYKINDMCYHVLEKGVLGTILFDQYFRSIHEAERVWTELTK